MPKRSTIGVIGCGYAAEVHLAAIGVLGGAEVAALADPDVDRMNTLARRHGISRCHTHWRELVEDPSIDIIAVLTPPTWHREMTLAAVRSGKHVMVEKPLVVDLDEADQLIQETGDSPVGIMIGYNLRFHQQVQQLRQLIKSGTLGKIQFVRGVAASPSFLRERFPDYRMHQQFGGGVTIELAVHYYDLWEYLLGERVQTVSSLSRFDQGEDMTAVVSASMKSGILVSGEFSSRATEQHQIEVYGEKARADACLYRYDGLKVYALGTHDGDVLQRVRSFAAATVDVASGLRTVTRGGVFMDSFRRQWDHFLTCIRARASVRPGLTEGRRSLAIALAAVQSANDGRVVTLDDSSEVR